MSLQHTDLPGYLLADLFRNSLISLPEELVQVPVKQPVQPVTISYMGKNTQHIMIGIYNTENAFLSAEAQDFLLNILKACQRNIDHVSIVNFATLEPTLAQLKDQLAPRVMMLFGSHPLFASILDNQIDFVLAEKEDLQIMRIPALDKMMETSAESRAMKGKLWLLLKQVFNL